MLSVYVGISALSYGFGARRKVEREESRGEKRKMGKIKRKDRGMDAQVLLLMDPGAELGWAELSDTLPSVGGEREHTCHHHKGHLTERIHFFGR